MTPYKVRSRLDRSCTKLGVNVSISTVSSDNVYKSFFLHLIYFYLCVVNSNFSLILNLDYEEFTQVSSERITSGPLVYFMCLCGRRNERSGRLSLSDPPSNL